MCDFPCQWRGFVMITVIKDFIFKAIAKLLFLFWFDIRVRFFPAMLSIMGFFCNIVRVLTISWLIQINVLQQGVRKNNRCYSPITIFSCTFPTNKLTGFLIESSFNITVHIDISKVSIIMSFLRKTQIDNLKKKEANNQEDEIFEQSLQSQRTEENGEYMWFSSYSMPKFSMQK